MNRVVAVFAHNESRNIISSLESVRRNIRDGDLCYVLNNGSADPTADIVRSYQKNFRFCRLIEIELGDKCNAWNEFIHELNIDADTYCFLDGDCRMQDGALDALQECLAASPDANAAAALPADGIGLGFRRAMMREGGLAGNLYALSSAFVRRIRRCQVRLPIGFIGDDALIGALAYWDLDPRTEWNRSKIRMCENARFEYRRLSPLSYDDVRLYYRRKRRYSIRRFQNQLLSPILKAEGLSGIPHHVDELYQRRGNAVSLEWRGINTWFDWLALRSLRVKVDPDVQI